MIETRTVTHEDGRSEVIRVLDLDELDAASFTDPVSYEKSIVWLEDISEVDRVHVALVRCCNSRTQPLELEGLGRLIGYSKLTSNAPLDPQTRLFTRRIFIIPDDDEGLKITNRYVVPAGTVDPKQILPSINAERVEKGGKKRSRFGAED
jgi:hypothetical protein